MSIRNITVGRVIASTGLRSAINDALKAGFPMPNNADSLAKVKKEKMGPVLKTLTGFRQSLEDAAHAKKVGGAIRAARADARALTVTDDPANSEDATAPAEAPTPRVRRKKKVSRRSKSTVAAGAEAVLSSENASLFVDAEANSYVVVASAGTKIHIFDNVKEAAATFAAHA